jgi:hypothetical protein
VLSAADSIYTNANTVVDMWNCECSCGSKLIVRGASLRNGHTSSCGCYHVEMLANCEYESKSEKAVRKLLDDNGCEYTPQKTFPGLFGLGGNLLSYDFCVNIHGQIHLIELNGLQHYEPVAFFGGNQSFGKQKVHDFRKKQYAALHNYPLLVVNCVNTKINDICDQVLSFLNL